uniref:Uncharacterized protein n=1 Tax=viral metagenome TaxID=1070528 RepID=A0A6C0B1X0_9ZZZZ
MSAEDKKAKRKRLTKNAIESIHSLHPDVPLSHITVIFKHMVQFCNLVSPQTEYKSSQSCSVVDIKNKINAFLYNRPEKYDELPLDQLIQLVVGEDKYKRAMKAVQNDIITTIHTIHPDVSPVYIEKLFKYMIKYCDLSHPEGSMPYSIFKIEEPCSLLDNGHKIIVFLSNRPENYEELSPKDTIRLIVGEYDFEYALENFKDQMEESPPVTPGGPTIELERSLSSPDGGKRRNNGRKTNGRKTSYRRKKRKITLKRRIKQK